LSAESNGFSCSFIYFLYAVGASPPVSG
jgi:hypothetical protein